MTVGAENNQKTWYLPKKVLTHCSPFFDAALNGKFVEASSKTVNLPEDDPVAFEMWATWLSLGNCEDLFGDIGCYASPHVQAWKLGDKLACPAFKDHVMFQLVDLCDASVDVWIDMVGHAYEGSSPGSKLRRCCVDFYMWDKLQGVLVENADELIAIFKGLPEFLEDVVKQDLKTGKDSVPYPLEIKHRYYENPAFKPGA